MILSWLKKLLKDSEPEVSPEISNILPIHPVKNKASVLVHITVDSIECRDCGSKSGDEIFEKILVAHTCGQGFEIITEGET